MTVAETIREEADAQTLDLKRHEARRRICWGWRRPRHRHPSEQASATRITTFVSYAFFHLILHTEEEVGELCLRPDHSRYHTSQFGLRCHTLRAGGIDLARELAVKKTWRRKSLLQRGAMDVFKLVITSIAPIFIMVSPVTSYADQILSIHRKRTSEGFSLDIPLIMLTCSVLKLFYWFGARYDLPLLIQASVMIVVQVTLLHIALLHRGPIGAQHSITKPFAGLEADEGYVSRPFAFWQWKTRAPYWQFLGYFTATLASLQLLVGTTDAYVQLQGYIALTIEAALPVPQILKNEKNKSCKGFRVSVLINWLIGDFFKLSYFYLAEGTVPVAFKLCGAFQAVCDIYLGVQYWRYGDGYKTISVNEKDPRLQ